MTMVVTTGLREPEGDALLRALDELSVEVAHLKESPVHERVKHFRRAFHTAVKILWRRCDTPEGAKPPVGVATVVALYRSGMVQFRRVIPESTQELAEHTQITHEIGALGKILYQLVSRGIGAINEDLRNSARQTGLI